jgi:hypothetical protein
MEHEYSLPRSQEPSTGPYPEPDQSCQYHLTLSIHLHLGLPSVLFFSGIPTSITYPINKINYYLTKQINNRFTMSIIVDPPEFSNYANYISD